MLLFGLNRAAYHGRSRSMVGVIGIGTMTTVGFMLLLQSVINYSPASIDAAVSIGKIDQTSASVKIERVQLRDCDPVVTQLTWIGEGWSQRVEPPRSGMYPPRARPLSRASYEFVVPYPASEPKQALLSEVYDCGARQLITSDFNISLQN